MTTQSPPSAATGTEPAPICDQLVRRARRVWRRAGVRGHDRDQLAAELHDELSAALTAGRGAEEVVGADPSATFRSWAVERGAAGRSLRLGLLGPLALGGIALGSLVVIVHMIITFTVPDYSQPEDGVVLTMLISAATTSMIIAPLSCWAALHRDGDPRAAATARWMLIGLPVGAVLALALAIAAGMIGSSWGTAAIPFIAIAIAAGFLLGTATARFLAVRYTRTGD